MKRRHNIPLCNVCGKPANNWSVGAMYSRENLMSGLREYRPKNGESYFRCDEHWKDEFIEINLGFGALWPADAKERAANRKLTPLGVAMAGSEIVDPYKD